MNPPRLENLARDINLILLFDHVGRAGNGFFLSVFDTHPQVLTCNWVHYLYSYLVTEFGRSPLLDARRASEFLRTRTYFRYVFNTPEGEMADTMRRFGADPDTPLDREKCRRVFDALLGSRQLVHRRDLILAAYAAYALGAGRDLGQVRYVLLSDAVSLRTEHLLDGFSGMVADCALHDFPRARLVSMVRDPRAMFASNRHQFVNSLGNMYAVTPSTAGLRFRELLRLDQRMENSVWLFWVWFAAQTGRTMNRLKLEHARHFLTVRNEDMNLRFVPAMTRLCAWLNVDFYEPWRNQDYAPTSAGQSWKGTGAYNSRYQRFTDGLLRNDPQEVADKVTGPNRYVTERWRSRLARHESELLDRLFFQEMEQHGYAPLRPFRKRGALGFLSLLWRLWRPFRGEAPSWRWLGDGARRGLGEGGRRLFYVLVFPVFAVAARVQFLRLYVAGAFVDPHAWGPDATLLQVEGEDAAEPSATGAPLGGRRTDRSSSA